jgi:anti-anti-sigma factor
MSTAAESRTPPPDAIVSYQIDRREAAIVVHCEGALVVPNFQRLDEMLRELKAERTPKMIIDLQKVNYIDSVGIGTLSILLKHTMTSGTTLILVANEKVKRALETSGLDRVFIFASSVEQALTT